MRLIKLLATTMAMLLPSAAAGYEIETHGQLSEAALEQSMLVKDPAKLGRSGFLHGIRDARQRYPDSESSSSTILRLVRQGARFEDAVLALPPRSIHHFFDPATGKGLSVAAPAWTTMLPDVVLQFFPSLNSSTVASPDWALDGVGGNQYSRQALNGFMADSYTLPTRPQRDAATGQVFETIGRLIHHVQDMAQPQHVRNDAHLHVELLERYCPSWVPLLLSGPECAFYRSFKAPSIYEQWTKSLPASSLPVTEYPPVYGSGDRTTFSHPRRFWAHDGKGLAEFTSRNFLSAGTTKRTPPAISAAEEVRAGDLCAGAVPPCELQYPDYYVRFFAANVDDRLRPTAGGINPRAGAESIYSADFKRIVAGPEVLTVNRFTFEQDHKYLLPRAVAYSASLIDYIFRGEMEVKPPAEGVYAVVDGSPAGCGVPCGFRKLRLKLRNTTPGDEIMGPGVLRAVVKYHRNGCHQPNLSGHYGGDLFLGDSCRQDESVAVSNVINVSGPVTRNAPGAELIFSFGMNNHIPIEATDVRLQILFRGRLGQEEDAVAITTVDIAEPNFVAVANNTDHYFDPSLAPNGGYRPADATNYPYVLDSVKVWFADPATQAGPAASLSAFGGGKHAQFAFLGDRTGVRYWLRTTSQQAYYDGLEGDAFPVQEFVLDEGVSPARFWSNCPVVLARGMYRQYVQMYIREKGGRIAVKSTGPARTSKDGVDGKLAAMECYDWVAPGQGGISDFSTLTPKFTATTASQWAISF